MGSLCRTSIIFDKQTAPVADIATTGRLRELYRAVEISLKAYVNTTDGGGGDDVMCSPELAKLARKVGLRIQWPCAHCHLSLQDGKISVCKQR